MSPRVKLCPYVGLRPFRESDFSFFFGRERDIRVISSNLLASQLTLLYGPSGVGKSSVLQAGVVPYLKATPKTQVLYFNDWQTDSFYKQLILRCKELLLGPYDNDSNDADEKLDEILARASARFFVLLDQFEEYLLYHPADGIGQVFDGVLARIVNREDVPARVLIGIREDRLSKLDQRFSIRIPNLLGNMLALEHLGPIAARSAIEGPIHVLNERDRNEGQPFAIDPALVEEILKQVQSGQMAVSESSGIGKTRAGLAEKRIETAFLQLVLMRLWEEETRQNSKKLRYETLFKIGGASEILQSHVNRVMEQFSDREREILVRIFRYLVTPSRTKIAQATEDLISYGEASEAEVNTVLNRLSNKPEARILRRLASPERYEIFHDVLAQPILDWRRRNIEETERAALAFQRKSEADQKQRELEQTRAFAQTQREKALAEQQRAEEQAKAARRLRWMVAALAVVILIAVGTALYALVQRKRAQDSEKLAAEMRRQAEQIKGQSLAAERLAQASLSEAEAARVQALGDRAEAEKLRSQAENFRKQAQAYDQSVEYTQGKKGPVINSQFALDFNGTYDMAHDGWKGRLTLKDTTGQYIASNGKAFQVKVAYISENRILFYVINLGDENADGTGGQKFVGYLMTQSRDAIAGTTWWSGRAFGFYAIKSRSVVRQ